MKIIKCISLGLFMAVGCCNIMAQCPNGNQKHCQGDSRPRPSCGAPYPMPECEPACDPECTVDFNVDGRPADPNMDPYRNLNLTDKQKAEIQKALDKRNAKAAKTRDRMQKERAKAQEEFDKSVRKVMTAAQYGQFKQNIGDARVRRYVGKPVPGPQPQIMK